MVWLLAMIGGFLFKRFIQGAKGLEQIPLVNFFKEFGNLEAVSVADRDHMCCRVVHFI